MLSRRIQGGPERLVVGTEVGAMLMSRLSGGGCGTYLKPRLEKVPEEVLVCRGCVGRGVRGWGAEKK